MIREMRRKERQMSAEDAIAVLKNAQFGTLSMTDENNIPYGIPISFAYEENAIYLHCALEGTKLDVILHNNNVCFSAVTDVEAIPEKFTTKFKSSVVFGKISIINDHEEKKRGFIAILKKYSPDFYDAGLNYMEKAFAKTNILKIDINSITGKEHK